MYWADSIIFLSQKFSMSCKAESYCSKFFAMKSRYLLDFVRKPDSFFYPSCWKHLQTGGMLGKLK